MLMNILQDPLLEETLLLSLTSDGNPELITAHFEDTDSGSSSGQSVSVVPSAPPSPPCTIIKRKHRRKPKEAEEDMTRAIDTPSKKVTYILSILSAEEAGKAVSKCVPVNKAMELGDNEPWDTIKAQLLIKISDAISPNMLDFNNYNIMFYIPHALPKPGITLSTEEDYAALLLHVQNLTSKTPTINLTIEEKKPVEDKENEVVPLTAGGKDGGKATKKKKEPIVLPGNVNQAANVQKLQEHWQCILWQPNCIGMHCYVFPDGTHLPLNHEKIECWASAMLKNDDSATLKKPPNHHHFDPNSMRPLSPVLQHHLYIQNAKTAAVPAASVFNISLGDGVLDLFQAHPAASEPATPQIPAGTSNLNKMLLGPACDLGPDMPITEFCELLGLQHTVLDKLEENAYDFAHNLCFITLDDLMQMGFKLGEKAALQDAVEHWSVPQNV